MACHVTAFAFHLITMILGSRKAIFDQLRTRGRLSKKQVAGVEFLLTKIEQTQDLLPNQAAYIMATIEWETARTFQPVREAFWLTERWRKEHLRYWPYYGRGYVQLTWRGNYAYFNLADNPDQALDPETAWHVCYRGMMEGIFTGHDLPTYCNRERTDFLAARRVVNGVDRATEIAAIAEAWAAVLDPLEPAA